VIVLLTDFGRSEYVGVMKGVILGVAPEAKVVDLCHSISAQSVIEGSWVLKNNYRYFPEGATFCCVVDPGVGTERRAVAVRTESYYFVGPDNGLLWETVKEQKTIDVRTIAIAPGASRTFHGRDVFAKAAAEIDLGQFETIGDPTGEIQKLEFYKQGTEGTVVRIDTFGNVVTNLRNQNKDKCRVVTGGQRYTMKYYPTYESAEGGELFLIEGSSSTLEISLKNGSANEQLDLRAGERITIQPA
jgi:S-adenosylmethionine hydrolase